MASPVGKGSHVPHEHKSHKSRSESPKPRVKAHETAEPLFKEKSEPLPERGPVRLKKTAQIVRHTRNASYLPRSPLDSQPSDQT